MFRFPAIMPDINITELKGEELEVTSLNIPGGFVPLEPEAEVEYAYYGYPRDEKERAQQTFSSATRSKVGQWMLIEGTEALEINTWAREAEGQYTEHPIWTRYVHADEDSCWTVATIQRVHTSPKWSFHKVKSPNRIPRHIKIGMSIESHDDLEQFDGGSVHLRKMLEVISAVELCLGPKTYKCLKLINAWLVDGENVHLDESYLADTGRTILVRSFAGPKAPAYNELPEEGTVEYGGVHCRYIVSCIPDHALVTGL